MSRDINVWRVLFKPEISSSRQIYAKFDRESRKNLKNEGFSTGNGALPSFYKV